VTVDADDDLLVAYVQVLVDGDPVGDPLTSEPYTIDWDAGQSTDGLHVLSALVYDASGNFSQSDVTIIVDNVLPTVTVVDPAHGSLLLESTVPVNATATDNDHVEGVQFALDGVPLGEEDTTEPYGILWDYSGVPDGSHQLSAIARDRAGNLATNAVSVSVDHTPPAVSVTAPAAGAVLTGTSFNVTASASDALGIAGVQFRWDGADLGARDTSSPFGVTWTGATDGSHTLTAVAEDGSGRFATAAPVAVTVDNTPPPATAQVRDGTGADAQFTNSSNTLSANWDVVVDPASGVAHYQMAIGTTSGGTNTMPFTNVGNVTAYTQTGLNLSNNAMYYVSIRAVDRAGLVGPVRISNGIRVDRSLPSVSITAPKNKATVKGSAVVVSASASDTYGIASVQFVLDDVNLGPADTASPYTMYWNSTTVPNGYHYLKATATDRAGNVRTSGQIRVTVSN
jgi:hypothetical protein